MVQQMQQREQVNLCIYNNMMLLQQILQRLMECQTHMMEQASHDQQEATEYMNSLRQMNDVRTHMMDQQKEMIQQHAQQVAHVDSWIYKQAMEQNNYLQQMMDFLTQAMIEHTSQDLKKINL
jgi:D-arabinose 1-dehydrogenase-like Zn-dependent alcohol dehydrogenase